MKHSQEFWKQHVETWQDSGLSQQAYCRRHRLPKGTLGYWSSKLKKEEKAACAIVEIGRAEIKEPKVPSAIELVIKGRYLLRLWPGMDMDHMRNVLAVLEGEL